MAEQSNTETKRGGHNYSRNHPSNYMGGRIFNAVTGVPTQYIVGSKEENIFFKVRDSSNRTYSGDVNTYFYDSPEQYVRQNFRRMRYVKKGEAPCNRQRKEDMLDDSEAERGVVLWKLMTPTGEDASDKRKGKISEKKDLYMMPYINPRFSSAWHAKRNTFLNGVSLSISE